MTPGQGSPWGFVRHDGNGGLRVSDADRDAVAEDLREHHAEGRLDVAELGERLDAVFAAKTRDELSRVSLDLPDRSPGAFGPGWAARAGWPSRDDRLQTRPAAGPAQRRFPHPLIAVGVVWLVLSGIGGVLGALLGWRPHGGPGGFPLLLVFAVLFLVLRRRRRDRQAGDRRRGITGSAAAGSARPR